MRENRRLSRQKKCYDLKFTLFTVTGVVVVLTTMIAIYVLLIVDKKDEK